ncbi:MAG: cupin domain-containing protein [Pseudomonadota bacterium]
MSRDGSFTTPPEGLAEAVLPTTDLTKDLAFFTGGLGFRLEKIFPSDNPAVAVLYGHGLRIRLTGSRPGPGGVLRILSSAPHQLAGGETELVSPGGTKIKIRENAPHLAPIERQSEASFQALGGPEDWTVGRAGMLYRDLLPGRLQGSMIASHIRIPQGGPVPDMVHFHTVRFQLIYCARGWVRLVYEDQGPPFILSAGDCVTQPPEIRHRVLEASDNLEVVEIGVPADHITTIDHGLDLPTPLREPDRRFAGQVFCHHQVEKARWVPWRLPGFEARETGVAAASGGLAGVMVARPRGESSAIEFRHGADLHFSFILSGGLTVDCQGEEPHKLSAGDSFSLPPDQTHRFHDWSPDLELLEVTLPDDFEITNRSL